MKNVFFKLVQGWNYFFTALKLDQEDKVKALETGIPVPNPGANIKNWWRIFGLFFIVVFASVFLLWNILIPSGKVRYIDKRRNHHGVNRYGKRY